MPDAPHPSPFSGFGPGALAWFEGLAQDNSREYWAATKEAWQTEVRTPLERLLGELAADWGGGVRMFRQHRDVRFSRDKSPLKTATYGVATTFSVWRRLSKMSSVSVTTMHSPGRSSPGRARAGRSSNARTQS